MVKRSSIHVWQLVIALAACSPKSTSSAPLPPVHSPYVVNVSGSEYFEVISFKDVGRERFSSALYASFAESLALGLSTHPDLNFTVSVEYLPELLNSSAHLACEGRHVYVDLWHAEKPTRWGYSLWSGCSQESNFAWEEVAHTGNVPPGDIRAVTSAMADTLAQAERTSCVTRRC